MHETAGPGKPGRLEHGFFVAGALNLTLPLFSLGLGTVGIYALFGVGLAQVVWLLPLWANYRRRGMTESAKGVVVVAGITFLLNAGCWGAWGAASKSGISG